jgi:dipeptidase E
VSGRLLLHSGGSLGPVGRAALPAFLGSLTRVAFVTAANLHGEAGYFDRVRAMLAPPPPEGAGLELSHLRWDHDPLVTLAGAEALFMGGGNTYALLARLRASGLLGAIGERVRDGMPYLGASAGSNVAGPNILTTNDWNVVALDGFDALGLVAFNINPHYRETDPAMAPYSETRDDRIREYHVVNANPVVGLEEGSWLVIEDGAVTAQGTARVKLFRRGQEPTWYHPGDRLPLERAVTATPEALRAHEPRG